MLATEAIIAWVIGALFLSYTCIKHIRGSEGIAMAAVVWALILFVAIPFTVHFMG